MSTPKEKTRLLWTTWLTPMLAALIWGATRFEALLGADVRSSIVGICVGVLLLSWIFQIVEWMGE
jgi:uncharacterized membrane protein YdbT with pleckstrin-like domain